MNATCVLTTQAIAANSGHDQRAGRQYIHVATSVMIGTAHQTIAGRTVNGTKR
jgi:hypothetical protein